MPLTDSQLVEGPFHAAERAATAPGEPQTAARQSIQPKPRNDAQPTLFKGAF